MCIAKGDDKPKSMMSKQIVGKDGRRTIVIEVTVKFSLLYCIYNILFFAFSVSVLY